MSKVSRKRARVVATVVVASLATAGAAWASWHSSGEGTASVSAGTMLALRATGVLQPNVPIYPGVKSRMDIRISNDNTFPVYVYQVAARPGPVTVDAAHAAAGCLHSGIELTQPSYLVAWNIEAERTLTFQLGQSVKMTNESDTACQGATFSIPLTVTARSKDS